MARPNASPYRLDPRPNETRDRMNLQPELDFCPECESKVEYDSGTIVCPNCGWEADESYVLQYEHSHGYARGDKNL